MRWTDQQYVWRGQNPYDVLIYGSQNQPAPPGRRSDVDPELGVNAGGYPPWHFAAGFFLYPLDWPSTRLFYTALNIVALALIAAYCWWRYQEFGWPSQVFAMASMLAGLPANTALLGCMVLVIGATMIALWYIRHRPLLDQFIVASIASRFWFYHQVYDNNVISFLLIGLLDVFFRTNSRLALLMVLLVGGSLWIPARFTETEISQLAQQGIWIVGLGYWYRSTWSRHEPASKS